MNLLQRILAAHGGKQHWEGIQSINMRCMLSGATLAMKGYPGMHEVNATIDTKSQTVKFEKLGNICGTFTPEMTSVGEVGSSSPPSIRHKPREHFRDHTFTTPWDAHHLVYFAGYAFWYYFNIPFVFDRSDIETREIAAYTGDNGEIWRGLEATFPDGFATHTKVQRLYFDDAYRLRRLDYHVDILPGTPDYVPAQHHCFDHTGFDQLIVPTTRVITLFPPGLSNICAILIHGVEIETNKVANHPGSRA